MKLILERGKIHKRFDAPMNGFTDILRFHKKILIRFFRFVFKTLFNYFAIRGDNFADTAPVDIRHTHELHSFTGFQEHRAGCRLHYLFLFRGVLRRKRRWRIDLEFR